MTIQVMLIPGHIQECDFVIIISTRLTNFINMLPDVGISRRKVYSVVQYLLQWDLLKRGCIEFKYNADGIHSGLTRPSDNS